MKAIHGMEIQAGEVFKAPKNITFGYQEQRRAFIVWFESDADADTLYAMCATGSEFTEGKLRHTVVMPDGFHVFHLLEIYSTHQSK